MKDHRTKEEGILIMLILFVAALVRVAVAQNLSLSNDELSALTRAKFETFMEMIVNGVHIDFHPAGVQSFIFFWLKLLGDDDFLFRLPFVICGILSVWFIYKLGKAWFSAFSGLFAASVFAAFQFGILYSTFARPYSPGLLFGLMAAWFWTLIFFPSRDVSPAPAKAGNWILFTLSMICCIHTHYFALVFAAGIGITGIFFLRRELLFPYLLSGVLILASFIPEWNIFNIQFSKGDIGGWLAPPGIWFLPQFLNHIFNDSILITGTMAVLCLTGFIITIHKRVHTHFHLIALSWFLFSFLLAYLYSILRHPVIQFSTLYFTFPFLLLLSGSWIEKLFTWYKAKLVVVALILITGISHTLFSKGLFQRAQFGVFKDISEDVKRWEEKYGKDNLSIVINVINPEYLKYYFRQADYRPEVFRWKLESMADVQNFRNEIDSLNSPYFCFAWSNASHPYEIIRILREYYPVVKEKKVYFNSAAYLFSKEGVSLCKEELLKLCYEPALKDWTDGQCSSAKDSVIRLDSAIQFGPGFRKRIGELPGNGYRIFSLYAEVRTRVERTNASLVISFDTADVPLHYHSLSLDECGLRRDEWKGIWFSRAIESNLPKDLILNSYPFNKELRDVELRNLRVTLENWDDPYQQAD